MPSFETMTDLEESLLQAGLGSLMGQICAAARPSLLLTRKAVEDDALPDGASKNGGYPDLPPGFAWPMRCYPDAERRAQQERETGVAVCRALGRSSLSPAQLEGVVAEYEYRAATILRPFPLAFQAQLNLSALSMETGFDPDLPKTGLLSIFHDVTGHADWQPFVFWHEGDAVRTAPPDALATCYDRLHSSGGREPWHALTKAEMFKPYSAVTIPDHDWPDSERLSDWLEFLDGGPPDCGADETDFHDRVGGWPLRIQGNPEDEASSPGERVTTPGETPWRHVFGFGGEYSHGVRLFPVQDLNDGNASVLMRHADLAGQRFERAVMVLQHT